jgi:hypothetical protein
MLNKVKIGMLIGVVLTIARAFLPNVDIPQGFEDAIMLAVIFVAQFFTKETRSTVDNLTLR